MNGSDNPHELSVGEPNMVADIQRADPSRASPQKRFASFQSVSVWMWDWRSGYTVGKGGERGESHDEPECAITPEEDGRSGLALRF